MCHWANLKAGATGAYYGGAGLSQPARGCHSPDTRACRGEPGPLPRRQRGPVLPALFLGRRRVHWPLGLQPRPGSFCPIRASCPWRRRAGNRGWAAAFSSLEPGVTSWKRTSPASAVPAPACQRHTAQQAASRPKRQTQPTARPGRTLADRPSTRQLRDLHCRQWPAAAVH